MCWVLPFRGHLLRRNSVFLGGGRVTWADTYRSNRSSLVVTNQREDPSESGSPHLNTDGQHWGEWIPPWNATPFPQTKGHRHLTLVRWVKLAQAICTQLFCWYWEGHSHAHTSLSVPLSWNKLQQAAPQRVPTRAVFKHRSKALCGLRWLDFALKWSGGDGLKLLWAGKQQEAAQPLWDITPLAFSRLGWGSWNQIPHPLVSYVHYKLWAKAKFSPCCTNRYKAGWAWVSLGTLQGRESEGNVTVDEKHKRGESWRPKGETELKNDQSPRYKHPVNSVFLF